MWDNEQGEAKTIYTLTLYHGERKQMGWLETTDIMRRGSKLNTKHKEQPLPNKTGTAETRINLTQGNLERQVNTETEGKHKKENKPN